MSVLVFVENNQGSFRKKSLESVLYAAHIAQNTGSIVTALVAGTATDSQLQALAEYGAQKILHLTDTRLDNFSTRPFAKAIIQAAKKESAKVIVALNDTTGRAVAPRVAANLMAGFAEGVMAYPDFSNGFVVKRNVFSGKAFANVKISSDIKVLTLIPNTFGVAKSNEGAIATIEKFDVAFDDLDFAVKVQSVEKASGAVPLAEAELVVSGGRGMKGPENWPILESLAAELGAATACSRPVADSHWRPHHEHVGQTGGTIRPNLYIAVGISGAIQHLAGVNGSKTIVVINKDPEAPFFQAANYGVLGDALEIVPRLTAAVRKFKQNNN